MSMASEPDGAPGPAAEDLHERITERRRELAQTVSALRDKTDVKAHVRDRAAGAEIAVADLARWAGRTADAVPRFVRWGAATAGDQARKLPKPLRGPAERATGVLRRRTGGLLAGWALIVVVLAMLARRLRRHC